MANVFTKKIIEELLIKKLFAPQMSSDRKLSKKFIKECLLKNILKESYRRNFDQKRVFTCQKSFQRK